MTLPREPPTPITSLDTADAIELAELLQFITHWLSAGDEQLSRSLADFVGHPAYGIGALQNDLRRFTFLLGADDGEDLFTSGEDH
ncbi:MAG: hypothetical protein ACHP9Z_29525 [Streptosporangiales bacterium]